MPGYHRGTDPAATPEPPESAAQPAAEPASDAGERAALPPRPPRPLVVHFGVDAAVAFLVMILVALMFGFGIVETAVVALVIGAIAAPFSRRAEMRALAAREEDRG